MKTKIYEELSEFFPLWRETILGKKGHEKREVQFILDVFAQCKDTIESVIDLGGGVGLHAILLNEHGFDVTLTDRSETSLEIARTNHPPLKTICSDFEGLNIATTFDAAICMWSTLSYIYSEQARETFYNWQREHIRKVIILDEANFYRYPANFEKDYIGENNRYKMKVNRRWRLDSSHRKETSFIYEIIDKNTNETKIIYDQESEHYVSVESMCQYLGSDWKLTSIYGDYDMATPYNKEESPRILAVFQR